jgi:PPOX class probable F420-dependent enzyme
MHVMNEAEYQRFLTEGTRTGKLATTRSDGRPHVAPVWFDLDDDGAIVLTTGSDSVKGKTLRRDPQVCLCVDEGTPPYSFVVIDGIAEITEDPGLLSEWTTRIAGRYMGTERAEEYGQRNATSGSAAGANHTEPHRGSGGHRRLSRPTAQTPALPLNVTGLAPLSLWRKRTSSRVVLDHGNGRKSYPNEGIDSDGGALGRSGRGLILNWLAVSLSCALSITRNDPPVVLPTGRGRHRRPEG